MGETAHRLGFRSGKLIEHGDGTVSYRLTLPSEFRVRISDVTAFSSNTDPENESKVALRIFGHGTELARVTVGSAVAERIEAWFRAHPAFGGNRTAAGTPVAPVSVADELTKLARLRDGGVLTEKEFATQKARLLGD
jgi:hypothetical protein